MSDAPLPSYVILFHGTVGVSIVCSLAHLGTEFSPKMVRIFYGSIANHGELERSLGVSQTQPENQSYPYISQIIRCAAGFAQSWKFIDNHGHHLTSCHWTHLPMFQKSTNHLPVRKRAQDRTLCGLWPLKTLGRGPFRTKSVTSGCLKIIEFIWRLIIMFCHCLSWLSTHCF